ncbi:hypothetical protein Aspvir_009258 [Aspergillus viridinutans]|uniref:Uncharacterized protein n=1 Tax=Aspergillus viridinutans TaxID=75553 RepID=A0A9P3F8L8_ASPVI|nr:uncharacterized protein Aspvir_009258 [Aspergillus viridinutans]GIK05156.1 hypothetical protein Aspvir_009258 [Aspergillus viridinutans]
MPASQGRVRGSGHNISGQFVVDGIWHNLNLYVTGEPLPDFNVYNARLTYESPRELRGREMLQPSSRVGGSDISLTLAGPSGTQSITGQVEPPLPEDFQISGQGAWGVYKDDDDD